MPQPSPQEPITTLPVTTRFLLPMLPTTPLRFPGTVVLPARLPVSIPVSSGVDTFSLESKACDWRWDRLVPSEGAQSPSTGEWSDPKALWRHTDHSAVPFGPSGRRHAFQVRTATGGSVFFPFKWSSLRFQKGLGLLQSCPLFTPLPLLPYLHFQTPIPVGQYALVQSLTTSML